jgi:hypothetical protein
MPVAPSFSYAPTGQPRRHPGSAQWWHAIVIGASTGPASVVPTIVPTRRHDSPASRPFRL